MNASVIANTSLPDAAAEQQKTAVHKRRKKISPVEVVKLVFTYIFLTLLAVIVSFPVLKLWIAPSK